MGDYYKSSYTSSGGRRRNQRSATGLIIDILVGVITLVVVALFLTTLFVPSLDPRQHGEVSTLGLVAPIIYAMQAALTLYWIVRWRPFIAVVMVESISAGHTTNPAPTAGESGVVVGSGRSRRQVLFSSP